MKKKWKPYKHVYVHIKKRFKLSINKIKIGSFHFIKGVRNRKFSNHDFGGNTPTGADWQVGNDVDISWHQQDIENTRGLFWS